jgi:transposase-like protein
VGVGTRFRYDGETVEVIELAITSNGNEAVLKDGRGKLIRLGVKELLLSDRARVIPEGPGPSGDDDEDIAGVVLSQLPETDQDGVRERAAHIREVLTGYRSGTPELAADGEPRPDYLADVSLGDRYASKAAEIGVTVRTIERWVRDYRRGGEAGLAAAGRPARGRATKVDDRWVETAREVMVEHTGESKPSRTMVIERTRARVIARFGPDAVPQPSRATAFRLLEELEDQHPLFRLSTKRNRDIADRPDGPYGRLRPTRPGEYLLMDSTRLDVFAFDPFTLRWVQAELSVGMDWYTRCITGIRLTPVSTKAVDVAAVLYQSFRPPPAGRDWPRYAVWPEHARERGMSRANMERWAHRHHIPIRTRGGASHNSALRLAEQAARTPAILRKALTSPYAWQRLERFAAAVRYPTLHEAARARGVTPAALIKQIQRLEKDLGQQLLERAERGHPMKLTPFGHKVATATRETLAENMARPGVTS